MSLNALLNQIRSHASPTPNYPAVRPLIEPFRHEGQGFKRLFEEILDAVGSSKSEDTAILLGFGLILDEDRTVRRVKREGIFRNALRAEDVGFHRAVAVIILNASGELGLSDRGRQYFRTVLHYLEFVERAHGIREELTALLSGGKGTLVKSLLAWVDACFYGELFGMAPAGATAHATGWTKEELAEGFSFLWNRFSERHKDEPPDMGGPLDQEFVVSELPIHILSGASCIRSIAEWGVLVDSLDFIIEREGEDGPYRLRAENDRTERALRYGYIQSETQALNAHLHPDKSGGSTLPEFARQIYEATNGSFVALVEEPAPRFILKFPLPVLRSLATDEAFLDEARTIRHLQHDLLAPDLQSLLADEGLSLWDLVKIHRVFLFLAWYLGAHLTQLQRDGKLDNTVLLNTLLPRHREAVLRGILSQVVTEEKANRAISLLSWRGEGHFDLQYQPILRDGTDLVVPMFLAGASDVLRNTLALSSLRPDGKSSVAMEKMLAAFFSERGISAEQGIKYKFDGKAGDLDVIVLWGSVLYVFECKVSLLPVSMHELRTTLDHLSKAGEQLERFKDLYQSPLFVRWLSKRLGWELSPVERVVTGIVVANRMLVGAEYGGHPVRALYELGNVLETGCIYFHSRKSDGSVVTRPVPLWPRGAPPNSHEFPDYFEAELLHERGFSAMTEREEVTQVLDLEMRTRQFSLRMEDYARVWGINPEEDEATTLSVDHRKAPEGR